MAMIANPTAVRPQFHNISSRRIRLLKRNAIANSSLSNYAASQ
jgi:hypothetical protein